jgi:hypothetical protein
VAAQTLYASSCHAVSSTLLRRLPVFTVLSARLLFGLWRRLDNCDNKHCLLFLPLYPRPRRLGFVCRPSRLYQCSGAVHVRVEKTKDSYRAFDIVCVHIHVCVRAYASVCRSILSYVYEKNGVFWDVRPCGSCKIRRFGGTWRLHHKESVN